MVELAMSGPSPSGAKAHSWAEPELGAEVHWVSSLGEWEALAPSEVEPAQWWCHDVVGGLDRGVALLLWPEEELVVGLQVGVGRWHWRCRRGDLLLWWSVGLAWLRCWESPRRRRSIGRRSPQTTSAIHLSRMVAARRGLRGLWQTNHHRRCGTVG